MKHVVLYVGHMYKPFWTKKNWPGWQGGSGKVKIGQNIDQNGPRFWLWSPREAPTWVKDPLNGPQMIPLTAPGWFESISGVLGPFRGLEYLSLMLHYKTSLMPSTEINTGNSQSPPLRLYPVVQKMINLISLRSLIKPPWKPEVHLKYKVNMSKPILQMVSGDHQHEYQNKSCM